MRGVFTARSETNQCKFIPILRALVNFGNDLNKTLTSLHNEALAHVSWFSRNVTFVYDAVPHTHGRPGF